jgi:hypothetical protein
MKERPVKLIPIKSENDVRTFFISLIKLTEMYHLSDAIKSMFDDGYCWSKLEHKKIMVTYSKCVKHCTENNLDIHKISCDVAQNYMRFVEEEDGTYDGCKRVFKFFIKLESLKAKKENISILTERLLSKHSQKNEEIIVKEYINKVELYDKAINKLLLNTNVTLL